MKLTKQSALKLALLTVLASTVSWDQLVFEHELQSTELAATGETTAPAGASGNHELGSTSDESKGKTPETLVVRVATTEAAKPSQPSDFSEIKACGESYKVKFQEAEETNNKVIDVSIRNAKNLNADFLPVFRQKISLENAIKDENKKDIDARLKAYVADYKRGKGETCKEKSAEESSVDRITGKNDGKTDIEKERIARGMKECRLNKEGETIRSTEKLGCLVERLENLGTLIEKERKTTKFRKNRRIEDEDYDKADAQRILAEIKSIAGPSGSLRTLIREHLLSSNESKQEDGHSAIERAVDAIKELTVEYDLGRTRAGFSSDIQKIVGGLQALDKGAELTKKSREYKTDAEELNQGLRESWAALKRDPLDQWAQQQYASLMQQRQMLQMSAGNELQYPLMMPFQQAKSAGYISQTEFTEFSSSFNGLMKLLKGNFMDTPTTLGLPKDRFTGRIESSVLGDYAVPSDLAVIRTPTGTNVYRSSGLNLPTTAPSMTFPAPRALYDRNSVIPR